MKKYCRYKYMYSICGISWWKKGQRDTCNEYKTFCTVYEDKKTNVDFRTSMLKLNVLCFLI